jgi:hypothetical protein
MYHDCLASRTNKWSVSDPALSGVRREASVEEALQAVYLEIRRG